jgi:hypothetical protein
MRVAISVLVCLVAVGCGGEGGSPTGPTNTAPVPYNQSSSATVSTFGTTYAPLSIPRGGTMTLTLSWGTGADLDLYLVPASCQGANLYPLRDCQILAKSDRVSGSSETISRSVNQGETFAVWVDNFSGSPQNYTLTVNIQ